MNQAAFTVTALSRAHDRSAFTCGVEVLDRYFRQQATQDIRRRIANCFVLTETATGAVAGYHTLSATSLMLSDLPDEVVARLPRYAAIPAALLGRLAVALAYRGRKLGSVLLADAIARSASADIAAFAILVDPLDQSARQFYRHHGFADLPEREARMFLTIDTALKLVGGSGL